MAVSETLTPPELLDLYRLGELDSRNDPDHKLALSVQGGAFASTVNAGVLDVFADQGVMTHVRKVAAISGGVGNGAGVLAGQTKEILRFYGDLVDEHFVDPKRVKKPIDMDLFVSKLEESLDAEAVIDNPTELLIGVTRINDCSPEVISSRDLKPDQLAKTIGVASRLPGSSPIDSEFIDGGYSWPTTPDIARQSGATHIIDLSNYPYRTWKYNKWPTLLVGTWLAAISRNPANLQRYHDFTKRQVDIINGPAPDDTYTVYPSEGIVRPTTFTQDKRILELGFIAGQNAACRLLKLPVNGIEIPAEQRRQGIRMFGKLALAKRVMPLFDRLPAPKNVVPIAG